MDGGLIFGLANGLLTLSLPFSVSLCLSNLGSHVTYNNTHIYKSGNDWAKSGCASSVGVFDWFAIWLVRLLNNKLNLFGLKTKIFLKTIKDWQFYFVNL